MYKLTYPRQEGAARVIVQALVLSQMISPTWSSYESTHSILLYTNYATRKKSVLYWSKYFATCLNVQLGSTWCVIFIILSVHWSNIFLLLKLTGQIAE